MTDVNYQQILTIARQLPLALRLRLASELLNEAANQVDSEEMNAMTADKARSAIDDVRAAFAALPEPRKSVGQQLDEDRCTRNEALHPSLKDNSTDVDA
jgi:hypothetical protein